uniref:C2H2-type domain-containing protein n=1 Tax=Angiostrongylus cantonensis TaxID=6313 RepID=A0A0K0DFJ7_ANGCA
MFTNTLVDVTGKSSVMSVMAEDEMKAGHLPAERVGGRRVVNKKDRRQSETDRTSSESSDEAGREVTVKDSSLPAQMEKSYPTSAVRHYHDKPQPTHQPHYANPPCHTSGHIFQPKKNC